ncbi:MAG: hypothetical protein IJ733_07540, partial [Lachnospiraceae bacterium]|nr:hypothetical protein [Lachnospiraceae bacterium]
NGNSSINNEYADFSTIILDNGMISDSYKSNTEGYANYLVWSKDDIMCTLGIDNYMEGWEYNELVKVANGIKAKYEDGIVE